MATPIGVDAPIATVLHRIRVALALHDGLSGQAEDVHYVAGVVHHLLQVAGAPRHSVIEHEELKVRPRFRRWELAHRDAQVVHGPGEPAPKPQFQRCDEGAVALFRIRVGDSRDQHPNGFGLEFAVEIQTIRRLIGCRWHRT